MKIQKVTPVRIVDHIEPCLPLWCGALGYEKIVEVPHDDALGFVSLENEAGEMMLQTRASLAADLPTVASRKPDVLFFIEVDSIEAAREVSKSGAEILVRERTTPYGMREAVIVDAQGTIVILAERATARA